MQTRSLIARTFALLCTALMFAAPIAARAQETSVTVAFANMQKDSTPINVLVGQSRVINFDRPIGRFSVSNPDIAEAVLVAPDQVLVNGKAFGQVNFIAWEQNGGKFIVFDVFVRTNLSLIDSQIRALFPKDDIRLSQANESVVLSGTVDNPQTVGYAEAVVKAAGFKTVNMLRSPTRNTAQVQLSVRVAEVSRNRLKDLGTSFAYQGSPGNGVYANTGGGPSSLTEVKNGVMSGTFSNALNLFVMGGNVLSMIRAMQQQGALRELAEPNLVAMDGQQASFLAGGEFPVPIVQTGTERSTVTVLFKEYGVRLNFKPTIIDEDHIRLELEPEVSTIDYSNGVKFDGFVIPALRTRRAKTGVELRDGQSFALAGLLDNNESRSLSKMPIVGDIPILGNLFKSKSYQKNETELIFIMTANLVKPVSPDDLPYMRGIDGLKNTKPLLGLEPKGEGINGDHGYSTAPAATTTTTPAVSPANAPATTNAPDAPANNNNTTPVKEGSRKVTLPAATSSNAGFNNLPLDRLNSLRPAPVAMRMQVSMVEAP
ncbi:MAG TPA: type II and III secretion system protein family protein [Pyrinomonadaceae bacterium]|jgi:pilus assembly protein CpaC|nr:type II and III secretion system protein family protein [Pyrinomonadaceae bacterium]